MDRTCKSTRRTPESETEDHTAVQLDSSDASVLPIAGTMADTHVFDIVAAELESVSDLDKLEARGTVRIALKEAGLEARGVSVAQMKVVLEKVLPGELTSRGETNADAICRKLVDALKNVAEETADGSSPEEVFARLGGT